MNITGATNNISKVLNRDIPAPSNRLNGQAAKSLESSSSSFKDSFDKVDKKNTSEDEATARVIPKAVGRDKTAAAKPTEFKKFNTKSLGAQKAQPKTVENTSDDSSEEATLETTALPLEAVPSKEQRTKEVTTLDQMDKDDAQPKVVTEEGAMIKFLYSMKTELGVNPEEVVKAMSNLDAESMLKPPEETMVKVLDQLQLQPVQTERAEELYQIMLKDTAEASMGKMLSENDQTVEFEVVGPEQLRVQKLLKSLDDLNGQFFDVKKIKNAEAKIEAQPNMKAQGKNQDKTTDKVTDPYAIFTPEFFRSSESVTSMAPEAATATESSPLVKPTNAAKTSESMPIEDLLSQLSAQGFNVESSDFGEASSEADSGALSSEAEAESFSSATADEALEPMVVAGTAAPKSDILNVENANRPGVPMVRTSDDAANTRSLVETAQMLAQKGGGSMKIQLRPEGLGFVELKVGVSDGKVDIQMITENNETKRLLESGLTDLKNGLVQHKLSLESVQVDTSNRTGAQLDTMLGQDRNTAREFLEQFREYNNNRREAGIDFGASGVGGSRGKKLRPEDVQYSSGKAKSQANSRRLDLVA